MKYRIKQNNPVVRYRDVMCNYSTLEVEAEGT